MTDVPAWWLIVGPLLGYVAAFASEAYRNHHAAGVIREERESRRQEAREDRRDEFERVNLLELQDSLQQFIRQAGRLNHLTEIEWRRAGTWGREPLPEDVGGEPSLAIGQQLNRLNSRTLDDEIRDEVRRLRGEVARAGIPAVQGEADTDARLRSRRSFDDAVARFEPLMELIGARIRWLHRIS